MTEAEQISELKKELQKLQDQIRALNLRPNNAMKTWERVLIYGLVLFCVFPSTTIWLYMMFGYLGLD